MIHDKQGFKVMISVHVCPWPCQVIHIDIDIFYCFTELLNLFPGVGFISHKTTFLRLSSPSSRCILFGVDAIRILPLLFILIPDYI